MTERQALALYALWQEYPFRFWDWILGDEEPLRSWHERLNAVLDQPFEGYTWPTVVPSGM